MPSPFLIYKEHQFVKFKTLNLQKNEVNNVGPVLVHTLTMGDGLVMLGSVSESVLQCFRVNSMHGVNYLNIVITRVHASQLF